MLRITQNSHASGAKSYYSSSDYYVDGQELSGVWKGAAAAKLGVSGEVERADWDAVCDGLNPKTGEKLLQRCKSNRTAGYDFNFHVPKSVSVLYATTKDNRILDAFRDSVDATMHDIEAEVKTRVRKDGKNDDRVTGNMIWGEFIHFTSRPVDGIPDPHLHAHCFVFNTTWDDKEHAWKAGQFRDLKRDAPYFEAMFHSRFARRLADLGLPIERTSKGWEIAGMPASLLDKFSRRTALIEETARKKGIDDPHEKAELGAKTRSRKVKDLSLPELQAEWRGRMSDRELGVLAQLEKTIGRRGLPPDEVAAKQAMNYAIAHEFERRSVVPERHLLATALKRAVGSAGPDHVTHHAKREDLIVMARNGRRMATTRDVLSEERNIINFARSGRGVVTSLGKIGRELKRAWLTASQQQAVCYILESHDRVIVVRGAAGVGKTAMMQEAVEAIEANGTRVVPLAPTADASRGVLRREGFKDAETVARFLMDEALQQKAKGQVVWIDEAGLLSAKAMANIFALADKLDARVLLTGDRRQHGSVERGACLTLLEDEAGIRPAEVKEIKRQAGEYKAAIKALSEGKVGEGFSRLDRLGWIHEIPDDERYKRLAADYVSTIAEGKTALVVSPTHQEGERITSEIRGVLSARGLIGQERRGFRILRSANLTEAERGDLLKYRNGDVLQFHQNGKGFKRGERMEVHGQPLPLDQANRFAVFHQSTLELGEGDVVRITHNGSTADGRHRLNNGALYRVKKFDDRGNIVLDNDWTIANDFGHLAYGYVVTSHASQGKTVDRVFIGQGSTSFPASSQEQFYVSCSRGRESATVYCDDKQALRDAVSESEDRTSATALVAGSRQREVVALLARYQELALESVMTERGAREYER